MIIMTITVYDDQGELVRAILFPPPLDFAFYSDFLKSVRLYLNSWTILSMRMILGIVIVTRLVIN